MEKDHARQKVTLRRSWVNPIPAWGEDTERIYEDVEIEGLLNYNSFRVWPINKATETGELDEMNMALLLSSKDLEARGLLNDKGYFEFDTAYDRFIFNGNVYMGKGDTELSQAHEQPLLFQILLRRERLEG